ncbi:YncE family protein [Pelosinus baikalensis]|uniref:YncE family protein n=1 Tax=Pelosinus baikalensis TaxID=2892015 RepID=A0ABS8I035_9FIRM|nr:YncE family protein [Pelosinus baikalensis]MCC5468552.1 YncE family protein [Pelosinus baikalensis]
MGIAISRNGQLAYIAINSWDIIVMNIEKKMVVETLTVSDYLMGVIIYGITATPDENIIYLALDIGVLAINVQTKAIVTITSKEAMGIAVTPDGKFVLASHENEISVIEISTNRLVNEINVVGTLVGLVIDPNGKFAYVANFGAGKIVVVDIFLSKVVTEIDVNSPFAIAITPNGKFIYTANISTNIVSAIDIATKSVMSISLGTEQPDGVAITSDGKFVCFRSEKNILIIDINTNKIVSTINVDPYAFLSSNKIAASPNSNFVYTGREKSLIEINVDEKIPSIISF